jgi:LysM repeat protein
LAPLALIAVMVALLAIVSAANNKGNTDSKASTSSQTTQATGSSTTASGSGTKPKVTRRRVYIVKVGDNLSTIAVKTGVSVDVLQALNPNVDPHAMTAGQKIRLK